jgi:hypothetical protein
MQVVPRHRLPMLLRLAGLNAVTREFEDSIEIFRLTVRERAPLPFTSGPHRKVLYPDGRIEGPFPVADRPALSAFVAIVFDSFAVQEVFATVPEGTFWLNNRAQSAYLWKVPDAQKVRHFLRSRGLTDRFRGGFLVQRAQFGSILPRLAANTYAGGADVLFTALSPSLHRLTATACHHFDIHFATPDASLIPTIADLADRHDLLAETLALPELPDGSELWG